MLYDQDDNHPVIKAIKKKGWITFTVASSQIKNEYSGWWIETYEAGPEHKPIDNLYLGGTMKDALFTIKQDNFPTLKIFTIDELMEFLDGKLKNRIVYTMDKIKNEFNVETSHLKGTITLMEWGMQYSRKDLNSKIETFID